MKISQKKENVPPPLNQMPYKYKWVFPNPPPPPQLSANLVKISVPGCLFEEKLLIDCLECFIQYFLIGL